MKTKEIQLVISLVSLAAVGSANASLEMNGGLTAGSTGTFTSSSLSLSGIQLVGSASGDFASIVLSTSGLTADTTTISGLSSTAETVNIPDYFTFSSSFIALGTSPSDRFVFNLATLTEVNSTAGVFTGAGTLVDTTGAYANTPADFTLSFSGPSGESFSLDTVPSPVPEPSTWVAGTVTLLPLCVGALWRLRKERNI